MYCVWDRVCNRASVTVARRNAPGDEGNKEMDPPRSFLSRLPLATWVVLAVGAFVLVVYLVVR